MLEPVSLHQTRFHAPGLAPDMRGVALGKQGAVLFPSLDGLVGWLRVISDEIPLDDLIPSLGIHEARSAVGSLAFLVLFHAESSQLVDRAARLAALLGGQTFTGTGRHLVKYRDAASPLGYDVDALSSEAGDFVLYAERFTQAVRSERVIPLREIVFKLSPRRLPTAPGRDPAERTVVWLAVAPGLGPSLLGYLHRSGVACTAALVEREGGRSAFGERRGFPSRYLVVRARELPLRMVELMRAVPGVALFAPVLDQVLVELGYAHPIRLESCRSLFDPARLYLFAGSAFGAEGGVDVIAPPPGSDGSAGRRFPLVEGEKLVAVGFDLRGPDASEASPARAASPAALGAQVTVRLVPSVRPPRRVTGALVGWEHAGALKRLVFALPPTVLAGCRAAAIDDGLLVLSSANIDSVPLGEPLYEVAPSVYAPVGWELLPRLDDALLAERLGGLEARVVVFRRGAPGPLAVDEGAFEPLGRALVARIEVEPRAGGALLEPAAASAEPPTVANDPFGPLSLFPLWGYRGGSGG